MAPIVIAQDPNKLAVVVRWIHSMYRRLICMVTGHTTVLHFEPRRLALRCVDCGHETPGWSIGECITREVIADTRGNMRVGDRAA